MLLQRHASFWEGSGLQGRTLEPWWTDRLFANDTYTPCGSSRTQGIGRPFTKFSMGETNSVPGSGERGFSRSCFGALFRVMSLTAWLQVYLYLDVSLLVRGPQKQYGFPFLSLKNQNKRGTHPILQVFIIRGSATFALPI